MAREIPYDPMHVTKTVTFKRMKEILAKHQKRIEMNLAQEQWFSQKLRAKGAGDIFEGDTTREVREQRARLAITQKGLEAVICGKRQGVPSTFAQVFEVVYERPL